MKAPNLLEEVQWSNSYSEKPEHGLKLETNLQFSIGGEVGRGVAGHNSQLKNKYILN